MHTLVLFISMPVLDHFNLDKTNLLIFAPVILLTAEKLSIIETKNSRMDMLLEKNHRCLKKEVRSW